MHTTDTKEIVYISSGGYPSRRANSVQVVKQCNGFAENGYQVLLLGRALNKFNSKLDKKKIIQEFGVSGEVKIELMRAQLLPQIFKSVLFPVWIFWKLHKKKNFILYGRHALGLLAGCISTNVKTIILECHGIPNNTETIALKILTKLNKLDRIVVISHALKNSVLSRHPYLKKDTVIVAHDGCDFPVNVFDDFSGLKIGYVGSFFPGRGLELISKLAIKLNSHTFHIIGGTSKEFTQITKTELPENVICHGHLPSNELTAYYKLFDVAIAPYSNRVEIEDGSNTAEYMSPLKIFEYMSFGKAIIASDLPVLREVLKDGENALLAKPDDIQQWENAILKLKNQKLRKKLVTKSISQAKNQYTWKSRANFVLAKLNDGGQIV